LAPKADKDRTASAEMWRICIVVSPVDRVLRHMRLRWEKLYVPGLAKTIRTATRQAPYNYGVALGATSTA